MTLLGRHGLDVFLVALALGQGTAILLAAGPLRWGAAALVVAAAVALLLRRFSPLGAGIAALLADAGALFVLGDAPTVVFFGLLSTFAIVAAINTVRDALISWVAGAGLVGVSVWLSAPAAALSDFFLTLGLCTVMWVAGLLLSRRTRQTEIMAMRLEVAELERLRALAGERARIARELHDVVSHGLTVVVLQTLTARTLVADLPNVPDAQGSDIDKHLGQVEEAARNALADMRRMLGLLETGSGAGLGGGPEPVPGLGSLAGLCARAGEAGIFVDNAQVDADLHLPAVLELTAYRIVQEALTNAIKHAPGSHVAVRVFPAGGVLHVEVVDDGGSPKRPSATGGVGRAGDGRAVGLLGAGGRGLVGMAERVGAYGGELDFGPRAAGGFGVTAKLPADASGGVPPSPMLRGTLP